MKVPQVDFIQQHIRESGLKQSYKDCRRTKKSKRTWISVFSGKCSLSCLGILLKSLGRWELSVEELLYYM